MKDIKIVEETATKIEDFANSEEMAGYDLESLQFTHRALTIKNGKVSSNKKTFYVAVFKRRFDKD